MLSVKALIKGNRILTVNPIIFSQLGLLSLNVMSKPNKKKACLHDYL